MRKYYIVINRKGEELYKGTSKQVKDFVCMSQNTSLSVYTLGRKWYKGYLIIPSHEFNEFIAGWEDYVNLMRSRYKRGFV